MNTKLAVLSFVAVMLVSGCNEVRNEQGGALVGAGLGALLGSQVGDGSGQIAAAVVGGLAGAYLGGRVGRYMDEQDRMRAHNVLETSPSGHTTSWHNPDTGADYAMTPTRATYRSGGEPCRDYTTDAWIDGQKETLTGTACRQPDGTWKVI